MKNLCLSTKMKGYGTKFLFTGIDPNDVIFNTPIIPLVEDILEDEVIKYSYNAKQRNFSKFDTLKVGEPQINDNYIYCDIISNVHDLKNMSYFFKQRINFNKIGFYTPQLILGYFSNNITHYCNLFKLNVNLLFEIEDLILIEDFKINKIC